MNQLDENEHFKKYLTVMGIFQDIIETVNRSSEVLMDNEVKIRAAFMNGGIYENEPFARLLAQDMRVYHDFKGDVSCFARYFLDHGTFKKESSYEGLLKAMLESHFGFYEIISRNDDNGIVVFQDVYSHQKYEVTDRSLAPVEGVRLFLFARLISDQDIVFPSGYTLPFARSKLLNKWLREHRALFEAHDDGQLAVDAYKLYKRCGVPVAGING